MASKETENFGNMTLKMLKQELSVRGLKLSGRKQELIERLTAYDTSKANQEELVAEAFTLETPSDQDYKELNASSVVPDFTEGKVLDFLAQVQVTSISKEAVNLYKDRFLQLMRISNKNNEIYIKSRCAAQMRKRVFYNVDVVISMDGTVEKCQCECPVGLGPLAHCKHVVAVLYGLSEFKKRGEILLHETCTQKLQSFHRPSTKFFYSPVKSRALILRRKVMKINEFDPRPVLGRNDPGYPAYFRNKCINFSHNSPNMPILQNYSPANLVSFYDDHDYFENSARQTCLEQLNLTNVSEEKMRKIEAATKQQTKRKAWLLERAHHITASNFGRICHSRSATRPQLAKSLLSEVSITSAAIRHGIDCERVAIEKYEECAFSMVDECGLYVSPSTPFLAASPDGLSADGILLEVKAPYTARHDKINNKTVPYLSEEDGNLTLSRNHPYYYQVQGQLYCCNKEAADFCVYTFKDFRVIRIVRDEPFITDMVENLTNFYDLFFLPAIFDKFLYKGTQDIYNQ